MAQVFAKASQAPRGCMTTRQSVAGVRAGPVSAPSAAPSRRRAAVGGSRRSPRALRCSARTGRNVQGELEFAEWMGAVAETSAKSATGGTWRYFAYGSNLHTSVLEGRRGVRPLEQQPGRVLGYRLAFNIPGMPFVEPSFASVEPAPGDEVHGVVFTLTLEDWLKICRTEGVPFGYLPEPINVQLYGGPEVDAFTLRATVATRVPRWRETPPSERYRGLIVDGAAQRSLSQSWQTRLLELTGEATSARR